MKLENYSPNYRQVLFRIEAIALRTAGGLYLPSSDFKLVNDRDFTETQEVQFDASKSDLVKYIAVKVGEDCTATKEGDAIILMEGIRPQQITSIDGPTKYYQVMEQQIVGKFREPVEAKMEDFIVDNTPMEIPTMPLAWNSTTNPVIGPGTTTIISGLTEEDYKYDPDRYK